jgi:gamma-glutamyltranspeptidase/glutathione hydrolase
MALVDHDRPLEEAVRAPRLHHQWLPDEVSVEAGVEPALLKGLQERGHAIRQRSSIGHANCIEVDVASGMLRAVADITRCSGGAEAY